MRFFACGVLAIFVLVSLTCAATLRATDLQFDLFADAAIPRRKAAHIVR
jgi:hypothetical protein